MRSTARPSGRFGFQNPSRRTAHTAAAVVALALTVGAGAARADLAALACSPTKTVDCIRDEVLILDGTKLSDPENPGTQLVTECTPVNAGGQVFTTCNLQESRVIGYLDTLLKSQGISLGDNQQVPWTDVVIFSANFGTSSPLLRLPNGMGRQQAGIIVVGDTSAFGLYRQPRRPPPGTRTSWPEPNPAGVPEAGVFTYDPSDVGGCQNGKAATACWQGFYNGYQVLAQAMAMRYLSTPAGTTFSRFPIKPDAKACSGQGGNAANCDVTVPIKGAPDGKTMIGDFVAVFWQWNSFFDFGSSLMGGNRWRALDGGIVATSPPAPYWLASPPYQGQALLRFEPLDLYAMGLLAAEDLPTSLPYWSGFRPPDSLDGEEYAQAAARAGKEEEVSERTAFDEVVAFPPLYRIGPRMGVLNGVRMRAARPNMRTNIPIADILAHSQPRSAQGSHVFRQLWVLVTKPTDYGADVRQVNETEIRRLSKWRRAWGAYFYMLTQYRGRVVTTAASTTDDSPEWEFGAPADDARSFVAVNGVQVDFPGPLPTPNSPVIRTVARVRQTPGFSGTQGPGQLVYRPLAGAPPIVIKGAQTDETGAPAGGAINTAIVRMRLPNLPALQGSTATLLLAVAGQPALTVRVPALAPDGTAPTLKADGLTHSYAVNLSQVPGFAGRTFTTFGIVPLDKPFVAAPGPDGQPDTVDIETISFTHLDDAGDTDLGCDGKPKPDGVPDGADNCPKLFNPDQTDADNNGVGDACEDFDQDGVVNACDNCALLTNSRQRDRNNNGKGDVCDPEQDSGCFLSPEALGGPGAPGGAGFAGAALLFGLVWAIRRRLGRRRAGP